MIAELGQFALILALIVAFIQFALPMAGSLTKQHAWQYLGRPTAWLQCALVATAYACLLAGFLSDDFSITYVADHSNHLLPTPYKFAAVWGGHEGSLMLWVLFLSIWTSLVAYFSKSLPIGIISRVLSVLGFISVGFLLFILLASSLKQVHNLSLVLLLVILMKKLVKLFFITGSISLFFSYQVLDKEDL